MAERAERARRRRSVAAAVVVMLAVAALFVFPTDASDEPVRHALAGLGLCAAGPLAWLFVLKLPFEAAFAAAALWPLYIGALATTRLGQMHWGYQAFLLAMWNLVGLACTLGAGSMLT